MHSIGKEASHAHAAIGSELVRDTGSFADIFAQFVDSLSDRLARTKEAPATTGQVDITRDREASGRGDSRNRLQAGILRLDGAL